MRNQWTRTARVVVMCKLIMTRTQAFGVLVLLGSGVALAAQATQRPTFGTTTHYVTLDVLVTDRDDRPVTGLTADDFRIVERGRPQAIADFAHVEIPVGERVVDPAIEPPPGSDIAVNSATLHDSRAIAIVVDDTVLGTDNIIWAKRVLGTLLGTFSPTDQVAFTYVRRSDLSRDFTNDAAQHARSVQRLGDALGLPGVSPRRPVLDLLATLENVVKTMASARQSRRVIVLVGTRGCNPHGIDVINMVCKGVVDRAREAGVPIYALDPSGGLDETIADPLAILAVATGGLRYRQAEPWLSPARLMTDNGSFYLLGYYPKPLPTDGKFQDVEVTVTRPGLIVRARRGYTAPGGGRRQWRRSGR